VWAISDLHADQPKNLDLLALGWDRASDDDFFDIILVAGDVSSDLNILEKSFNHLKTCFDEVFFTVGNHECWTAPGYDSCLKTTAVSDLALRCGISMRPVRFRAYSEAREYFVCVFPLFSWYHPSWDREPDVEPDEGANGIQRRWADFRKCSWPESIIKQNEFTSLSSKNTALSEWFADMNEPYLDGFQSEPNETIISLSHFLPHQELCPEKRFLPEPELHKVIGSDALRQQVGRLRPDLHLFGHTHIPFDMTIDGTHFLSWPLGYVREQSKQCRVVAERGPLLVFERGVLQDTAPTWWGEYYDKNKRIPTDVKPAPWVLEIRKRQRERRSKAGN
jgi:predicted phosphodiesterase